LGGRLGEALIGGKASGPLRKVSLTPRLWETIFRAVCYSRQVMAKGKAMKRLIPLFLLASSAPALTGCLPMMAVSAASMAVQGAQGTPTSNADLHPAARDACMQEAAKYGTPALIDVEQHKLNEIVVWGTVDDGKQKRSFECDYGTRITGFKLRDIRPEQ
jgi:hypothetical protein